MSKFVNGQRYDTDFFPIDDQGNRIGDRDLGASETWTNANEPWRNSPGWHAQPLSAEQSAGRQAADPAAWAAREQWRAMNPTTASGGPVGGGSWNTVGGGTGTGTGGTNPYQFDWGGWNVGGANPYGGPPAQTSAFQQGGMSSFEDGGWQGGAAGGNTAAYQPPGAGGGGGVYDTGGYQLGGGRLPKGGGGSENTAAYQPPNARPNYPQTGTYAAPELDGPALLSQLGQGVQQSILGGLADPTVDQNSPAYRAAIESNNRNLQRATDRRRASEAQRAHAGGTLRGGGFDARVSGLLEDQGNQEADFESGLMQSELSAGRERQARAQQLGAGLLSQEQQQDLQSRLANQGSRLQTNALNTQDRLGTNDSILRRNALMLQQQLGLGDLDLRRLGLTNQNSQYYAGLGQQLGLSQAQMNQQALLSLLGGF